MINCDEAALLLPEYLGKSTSEKENMEIAMHISHCGECRSELAFWISMKQASKAHVQLDFAAMYNKLPKKESELEKILNSRSPGMAFDLIRYTFSIVNDTRRLASAALM